MAANKKNWIDAVVGKKQYKMRSSLAVPANAIANDRSRTDVAYRTGEP
jgi:hypothetical protein